MQVAIRCNGGGGGYGMGHLMRCLSLAHALRERSISCLFICRDFAPGLLQVHNQGFEVCVLSQHVSLTDDLVQTLGHAKGTDCIVVDAYDVTADYLDELHAQGQQVVYFDDLCDHLLPVDIVVGSASRQEYGAKLADESFLFSGPHYLPLRSQFEKLPPHQIGHTLQRVLLTFGGEDSSNAMQQAVEALQSYSRPLQLELLVGAAYRYKRELSEVIERSPHRIQLHQNLANPLSLYQEVDAALTAAGTTLWELAAAGVPMAVWQTADNQRANVRFAEKNQLAIIVENNPCESLLALEPRNVRQTLSRRGQQLVDGTGAKRLAAALEGAIRAHGISVRIVDRNSDSADSRLLWQWRNDSLTRQMSRDSHEISWEEHRRWYQAAVQDENKVLLIAESGDTQLGMLRFDLQGSMCAEINLAVNPLLRNHRWGLPLLLTACRYGWVQLHLKQIEGYIKPDNTASLAIFENAGFIPAEDKDGLRHYIHRECP